MLKNETTHVPLEAKVLMESVLKKNGLSGTQLDELRAGALALKSSSPNGHQATLGQLETNVVAKLFKMPRATGSSPAGHEFEQGECPMDASKFREHGHSMIEYIGNYLETLEQRPVIATNLKPGYLRPLLEQDAPTRGQPIARIMQDFEEHILPGMAHWQHPHFHAYFPNGNGYPSILASLLSDSLGSLGFTWASCPAFTELEVIMIDWVGRMIGLPEEFLSGPSNPELDGSKPTQANGSEKPNGVNGIDKTNGANEATNGSNAPAPRKGGGVIQGSASECVLVSLLAARHCAIEKLRKRYPDVEDGVLLSKLVAYSSEEAHSCVEKAAIIGFVKMRALETDESRSLRGDTLARTMAEDKAAGLEPFFVCATVGSTACAAFDNLQELGQVCRSNHVWLHVDAAYAGSALICPEFRYLIRGIELASSINMNASKWMLVNFDCCLMWVKDQSKLTKTFAVDPIYLQHNYSDEAVDYRHWGIPLSRRFRSLKLWFVIRNYGIEGLQAYIRNHVRLAKLFEQYLRQDGRFSIENDVVLGLVCFRLNGSNELNERLLARINSTGKLHVIPSKLDGKYVVRFCVSNPEAKEADMLYAYRCISESATQLMGPNGIENKL